MENASKALIIAGAILLSILIIGFGMAIYNNSSATKGAADLSGEQIAAHNQSFRAYQGKINGTQVKALLTKINNNNKAHEDRVITVGLSTTGQKEENTPFDVTANNMSTLVNTPYKYSANGSSSKTNDISLLKKEVFDNTTYKVEFDESTATGFINVCYIYLATN